MYYFKFSITTDKFGGVEEFVLNHTLLNLHFSLKSEVPVLIFDFTSHS